MTADPNVSPRLVSLAAKAAQSVSPLTRNHVKALDSIRQIVAASRRSYTFSWYEDEDEPAWATFEAGSEQEAWEKATLYVCGEGNIASRTLRLDSVKE